VSPPTLIFLRFGLGTALLLAVLAGRGGLAPLYGSWRALAGMGFVGVFVHQNLQAHALVRTTATSAGWLIGLIPIWTAVLGRWLRGERFGRRKVCGLVVGLAGAILVVTGGKIGREALGLPSTRGDLLFLASTLNWAVYTVLGHGTLRRLGALPATAGAMVLGWAMLAPGFVLRAGWAEIPALTAGGWGSLLFLGLACSGLGYLFWYGALEKIEASRVAAFLYLEPLVTLATAAAWLGERPSAAAVAGGLLVLLGVYAVQSAPLYRERHVRRRGTSAPRSTETVDSSERREGDDAFTR
jgi:drug/metabolite transporter (DMT)-like permease